MKVSFKEKRAWLVVDETVTNYSLEKAISKARNYKVKVIERK